MTTTTNIKYEVVDELCNTSKRGTVNCKEGEEYTDAAAIRRVKKAIAWNGVRCVVEKDGEAIMLRPLNTHQVCIITFHSFGRAS